MDCYNEAIENGASGDVILNNVFVPLFHLGRYEEALSNCNQVLEHNSNNYMAWYNKSLILKEYNEYEDNLNCINVSLELTKENEKEYNVILKDKNELLKLMGK